MIDTLCDQAREEDLAVAWLYCDYLAQQEQTTTNIMGAILKQLVGRGDIPEDIREAFQEAKKVGGRRLLLVDLIRKLKFALASLPQAIICIDALDEFLPKNLPELLDSLRDIVRESPGARIFLTGRSHVKEVLQRYFTKAAVISISTNKDDIRNYLEMRFERDDEPGAMNKDLREDILKIILDKMSDMCVATFRASVLSMMCLPVVFYRFLLASLTIDSILDQVTVGQRRKKLEEMTQGNGLSDAYTETLTRLKGQKGNRPRLGLRALMWVLYAQRPLRAEELCHALAVEIGSADLDPDNIPAIRTLLASSQGLLTVEASSSKVRPVHFTLQEHLSSDPTIFDVSPHSTIAEVCLTYINFESVRNLSPNLDLALSKMPLLEYTAVYWIKHTRGGMTKNIKILVRGVLDGGEEHIFWKILNSRAAQGRDYC